MTPEERMEKAASRFSSKLVRIIGLTIEGAWALERERIYAELAELRDEVHELTVKWREQSTGDFDGLAAEVVHLNRRMESLTATVAGLMQDNELHSVRVDP